MPTPSFFSSMSYPAMSSKKVDDPILLMDTSLNSMLFYTHRTLR